MRRLLEKYYRIISRFILRRRLKNKDFTILTDTCIGGVIYHELGLQFLSPTINLWMHDKDFYKFVNNLGYYLALPLKFVEGIENYPTAYLGDILIHSIIIIRMKMQKKNGKNARNELISIISLLLLLIDHSIAIL